MDDYFFTDPPPLHATKLVSLAHLPLRKQLQRQRKQLQQLQNKAKPSNATNGKLLSADHGVVSQSQSQPVETVRKVLVQGNLQLSEPTLLAVAVSSAGSERGRAGESAARANSAVTTAAGQTAAATAATAATATAATATAATTAVAAAATAAAATEASSVAPAAAASVGKLSGALPRLGARARLRRKAGGGWDLDAPFVLADVLPYAL